MDGPETQVKYVMEDISKTIRHLRQEQGLTIAALAKKAGLTRSYVSQIEKLKREPTFGTVGAIAYALGVNIFTLIGRGGIPEEESLTIVKPEERRKVTIPSRSARSVFESINHGKKDKLMEGYVLTEEFQFSGKPIAHEGEELLFMIEGKQEFVYDGKSYVLEEGDCCYFDAHKPHHGRSIGEKLSKALIVVARKPR